MGILLLPKRRPNIFGENRFFYPCHILWYDKDGDLDAYILNNSNVPVSSLGYAEQREVRAQDWAGVPDIFKGVGDMLLRNDNGKICGC